MQIFVVGENEISRIGLSQILKNGGFGQIDCSDSIDEIFDKHIDDDSLVILDCISRVEQAAAVERLKLDCPASKVVVLTDVFDLKTMLQCFHLGAQGYILKSIKSAQLIAALQLAGLGEKVVPSDFVDVLGSQGVDLPVRSEIEHEIELANISPREFDVLCCLMAGYPNKVIARKLDVCEATVKVHVKAILRKLNVRNRTQAAIWAKSRGIGISSSVTPFPDHA